MSGGYLSNTNDRLAGELFGVLPYPSYEEQGADLSAIARQVDPLEDKLLSELTWDMLCVLNAYDYYKSGDICEESYREDVDGFKAKWLKPFKKDQVRKIVTEELEATRKELYRTFGLEEEHGP